MVSITMCLIATTLLYDERGLAGHPVGKSFCAIWGYVSFEIGATRIVGWCVFWIYHIRREQKPKPLGLSQNLDEISVMAVTISAMVIFTTIHSQDFPDVDGDRAAGRTTFPIYAPKFSRWLTLAIIPFWSGILCYFSGIGVLSSFFLMGFGALCGYRYFKWRTVEADRVSYRIFNVSSTHAVCFQLIC